MFSKWVAFLALGLAVLVARAEPAEPVLQLTSAQPVAEVPAVGSWLGYDTGVGIAEAAAGQLQWRPLSSARTLPLGPGMALWLKLTAQREPGSGDAWQLEFPVPILDEVTVFQRTSDGRWTERAAGDRVPMRAWPQAGRYPFFLLDLPEGPPSEIYVRVRHVTPLALSWRVVTTGNHYQRTQFEYLALGMVIGALVLLVSASFLRAVLLRDNAYLWYAGYALVAILALAAFTGVAAHLLWGNAGRWVDVAPGVLASLGGCLAMVIVTKVSEAGSRSQALGLAGKATAAAGLAIAVAYAGLDRNLAVALIGAQLLAVAALSLALAVVTFRRGDRVGVWMLLGALPLSISVGIALTRTLGLIQASWLTDYALVIALTFDLPMLFGALSSRSRERRSVALRQAAAANEDPLTGLPRVKAFHARLAQAGLRHVRTGESAAVLLVELANHDWIQKSAGPEAAEEALLRAVIKLRALLRDVDTIGRVGERQFAILVEGASRRDAVQALASRMIAAGLMQDREGGQDLPLHFHVAALLLNERVASAHGMMALLEQVLAGMSPRTQRPVRFADAGDPASLPPRELAPAAQGT